MKSMIAKWESAGCYNARSLKSRLLFALFLLTTTQGSRFVNTNCQRLRWAAGLRSLRLVGLMVGAHVGQVEHSMEFVAETENDEKVAKHSLEFMGLLRP